MADYKAQRLARIVELWGKTNTSTPFAKNLWEHIEKGEHRQLKDKVSLNSADMQSLTSDEKEFLFFRALLDNDAKGQALKVLLSDSSFKTGIGSKAILTSLFFTYEIIHSMTQAELRVEAPKADKLNHILTTYGSDINFDNVASTFPQYANADFAKVMLLFFTDIGISQEAIDQLFQNTKIDQSIYTQEFLEELFNKAFIAEIAFNLGNELSQSINDKHNADFATSAADLKTKFYVYDEDALVFDELHEATILTYLSQGNDTNQTGFAQTIHSTSSNPSPLQGQASGNAGGSKELSDILKENVQAFKALKKDGDPALKAVYQALTARTVTLSEVKDAFDTLVNNHQDKFTSTDTTFIKKVNATLVTGWLITHFGTLPLVETALKSSLAVSTLSFCVREEKPDGSFVRVELDPNKDTFFLKPLVQVSQQDRDNAPNDTCETSSSNIHTDHDNLGSREIYADAIAYLSTNDALVNAIPVWDKAI